MEGSNLDSKENNYSSKKVKGVASGDQNSNSVGNPTSSFLSNEGSSLSLALMASRCNAGGAGRKRKTTFLSGKQQNKKGTLSRSQSSSSSKSVSLNHVVFMAGDQSQSAMGSQLLDSTSSHSRSFLGTVKSSSRGGQSKSRSISRKGSSLWSKVCSKNFRG